MYYIKPRAYNGLGILYNMYNMLLNVRGKTDFSINIGVTLFMIDVSA